MNYVQDINKQKTQSFFFSLEFYLRKSKHDLRIVSIKSACLALSSVQPYEKKNIFSIKIIL